MGKKFKFSFALAVCTLMLLASGPICAMIGVDFGGVVDTIEASAVNNIYVDDLGLEYEYKTVDSKNVAEVSEFDESTETVVIPSSITVNGKSYSVTSIGIRAFKCCYSLKSVTIPNSVTSIGWSAFSDCTSLTSITIPNSVTSISEYAFDDTAWYDNQADGVVYVGNLAYTYKGEMPKNTSITLKAGTVSIAKCAFKFNDSLTSITLPDSVENIGESAFLYCGSLTSINVSNGNKYYSSENGVLFNKNKTILIEYPLGKTTTSYTIPNSVTNIEKGVFGYCNSLTSVTIPASVKSMEEPMFYLCDGLTSINVSKDNKYYSSEDGILFNKDKTRLIRYPIAKTSTSYTTPNSVKVIGESAFADCNNLRSLVMQNSVTSIEYDAFSNCNRLNTVTIPSSVTNIGSRAFFAIVINIEKVNYTGTEAQWNNIKMGDENYALFDVDMIYNYSPSIKLSPPTIKTYSKHVSAVKLYWNKAANATGYRVYMKVGSSWKILENIFDANATSYYIGNLSPNTSYQFCIRSFSKNTDGTYSWSGLTPTYTAKTAATKTQLKTTTVGYETVKLNWVKTTGATGYVVKQKVNGSWKTIKVLSSAYDYYYVSNLKQGTKYDLYVTAYVKSGSGKISYLAGDFDTVTTNTTQVKINTTYANTKNALKIYWNKVSVASGYRVYTYCNGKYISAQNVTTNSYYKGGLKAGTKYQFIVKAYKINPNKTITWYANSSVKTTYTEK